jgi:hypothetical protein
MTIHEPATLLTDCLLAALAGWLGWRLHRRQPAAHPAVCWWRRALGLTALSALVGGFYHGFGPNFPAIADAWWTLTLLLICLLSAAMGMSLLHEVASDGARPRWRMLLVVKSALFICAVLARPAFVVAILDYGLVMLAWAAAALMTSRAWRGWMLAGVGLSFLSAMVQQMGWSISPHFNHNDLYHVIQALALYGFYRAAFSFGSVSGPSSP